MQCSFQHARTRERVFTDGVQIGAQATQARVQFVKDEAERERMWERRHEIAADKIYSLCTELGGFFLKVISCCV